MTKTTIQTIAIADITFDRELQFRTYTDAAHVADLASVWEKDGVFEDMPQLTKVTDEEGNVTYYIKDGTHRILGAKEAGATELDVEIEEAASKEEAMFAAMGVNTKHGKAATADDLKLALRAIKASSVASKFMKNAYAWDNAALLELLGCSQSTLTRAKKETTTEFETERDYLILEMHKDGKSGREIEKALGVNKAVVARVVKLFQEEQETEHEEEEEVTVFAHETKNGQSEVTSDHEESAEVTAFAHETKNGQQDEDCPFDLGDDVVVLGDFDDEDDEDGLGEETDALIDSLCRREESSVVKPNATPSANIDAFKEMFFAMTAEEQTKALRAINVIK
ncbi:hypothetical protein F2P58_23275 [Vibrio fortis]|uniref:ParB/Sulfiredoxin domain-containing protein n=1 Tax=Vibrio fortis TaxID=212667 RepID=A0A5N3QU56_9VIBR|nr:hypothetical protein [Vibrio fortis]KAB0285440.1 hypothetical protein F2P58_23275 [Vibrio fortis]